MDIDVPHGLRSGRAAETRVGFPGRPAEVIDRATLRPVYRFPAILEGSLWAVLILTGLVVPDSTPGQETGSEEGGQPLLDQAVRLRLSASSMNDLERVVELGQQAIRKGLDEESAQFAKSLIHSTLFEHGSRIAEIIFRQKPPDQRWPLMRQIALRDLEKALTYDSQLGEAHLLIARLHLLPRGDLERGRKAAEAAAKLITENPQLRSTALVARGQYRDDQSERLADFTEAIRLDPRNVDAWRERGLQYLLQENFAQAVEDFSQLLDLAPEDVVGLQAVARALFREEKLDEALHYINKAIEVQPDRPTGYMLRAQIQVWRDDITAALSDLGRALDIQPGETRALVFRASLWYRQGKVDYAKADLERALDLEPDFKLAVQMRIDIARSEGRFSDAIADLNRLLQRDPRNAGLRLQIAVCYHEDDRPRKAIEICTSVLQGDVDDDTAGEALSLRAGACLTVGRHAQAIDDYEAALKLRPDDSLVLNNLAWVLATSPRDQLRNGQRSVELATRACEVTDYKAPHILSTLASGYAEMGDFDTAIQWSTKAVDLARQELAAADASQDPAEGKRLKEQLDQLEQELARYRQKQPWRELLEKEDRVDPAGAFDEMDLKAPTPDVEPADPNPTDDSTGQTDQESRGQEPEPETPPGPAPDAP
jgi:tetratricopeptide (TPR) repeat protein